MLSLQSELFEAVLNLLWPRLQSDDDRKSLVTPLFSARHEIYSRIVWTGDARAFATRLIELLPLDLLIELVNSACADQGNGSTGEELAKRLRGGSAVAVRTTSQYREYLLAIANQLAEWETKYTPLLASFDRLPLYARIAAEGTSPSQEKVLDEIVRDTDRLVILGVAGSGKSSTLRRVTLDAAKAALSSIAGAKVPILLSLRDFQNGIEDWAHDQIRQYGVSREELIQDLEAGRFLIIFDGANEVPAASRDECYRQIRRFRAAYSRNRIILSSRPEDFDVGMLQDPVDESTGFRTCTIRPLTRFQISDYLRRYLAAEDAENMIGRLQLSDENTWQKPNSFTRLASVPLFLLLLIRIYKRYSRIPRNEGEMLNQYVDELLTQWEPGKDAAHFSARMKKDTLGAMAASMFAQQRFSLPLSSAYAIFHERLARQSYQSEPMSADSANELWLELQRNSLIVVSDDTVHWPHPLYRDLFAGMEQSEVCFSGGLPNQTEIEVRFSATRVRVPSDPQFQSGIMMLCVTSSAIRIAALLAVGKVNPQLVRESFDRLEPEHNSQFVGELIDALVRECLSNGNTSSENKNAVDTLRKIISGNNRCVALDSVAKECPFQEGRVEALSGLWYDCPDHLKASAYNPLILSLKRTDVSDDTIFAFEKLSLVAKSGGQVDRDLLQLLLDKLLSMSRSDAERMAVYAQKWIHYPDATDAVMKVARSRTISPTVRIKAIWLLGRLFAGDVRVCKLLCDVTRNGTNELVRREAVEALRGFRGRQVTRAVVCALRDESAVVRLGAVSALSSVSRERAISSLASSLGDEDAAVRQLVRDDLTRMLGNARLFEKLKPAWSSTDVIARRNALGVLANIAANSRNEMTRVGAYRILNSIGDERDHLCLLELARGMHRHDSGRSTSMLTKLVNDKDATVVVQAKQVCEELGLEFEDMYLEIPTIPEPDVSSGKADPKKLRDVLIARFNVAEIEMLCFDLDIDAEDVPGTTKPEKARELVRFMDRRGHLPDLIAAIRKARGNVI